MKKLIIIGIFLLFGASTLVSYVPAREPRVILKTELDFPEIWKKGYLDGWCYDVRGHCIKPIPPIAPLPRIEDTTYTHIYNRGFIYGRIAWRKKR